MQIPPSRGSGGNPASPLAQGGSELDKGNGTNTRAEHRLFPGSALGCLVEFGGFYPPKGHLAAKPAQEGRNFLSLLLPQQGQYFVSALASVLSIPEHSQIHPRECSSGSHCWMCLIPSGLSLGFTWALMELRFGGMKWILVPRNGKSRVLPQGDTNPEEQEA